MCYDIKILYETALKRAKRKNDLEAMQVIEEELKTFKSAEFYHVSGYSHPKIPVYTNENSYHPKLQQWGLIPFWTKDEPSALSIQNKTLNARFETIFERPAFRFSAKNKRCLIYVDGFFEHHHFKGKIYPYFIQSENIEPLCFAGLWDEWTNPETGEILSGFSIVTTKGQGIMNQIHNNPKLAEPRMPLILSLNEEEIWLDTKCDKTKLESYLSKPKASNLKAYSVQRLRGKNSLGNVPEIIKKHIYNELLNDSELAF